LLKEKMMLSIVVAISRNGVIGQDNQLPWHLPEDLKYFKQLTMGKPIVMGRKTYESIGRPLPGRTNIVITRNARWQAEGVTVVNSLEAAIKTAEQACIDSGASEAMVIGGSEIYRQALDRADRLYITEVNVEIEGDAYFPDINYAQWNQLERVCGDDAASLEHSFLVYGR
jgi:dihydrofolate reductase